MKLSEKEVSEIRECLEILNAVEILSYHNVNWLSNFCFLNPKKMNEEKRNLIERALKIIKTSAQKTLT
jgi:hypothetical protein